MPDGGQTSRYSPRTGRLGASDRSGPGGTGVASTALASQRTYQTEPATPSARAPARIACQSSVSL